VKAGIYLDDCSVNGTAVTRGVSIVGDAGGQYHPLIDCGGAGRAISFQPSTPGDAMLVESLHIANGYTEQTSGGAIAGSERLTSSEQLHLLQLLDLFVYCIR
jgi:hypothetical protein